MILFVTFYIIFSYFIIINGDVKVNIKYGTIEGFEYKCVKGKNYNVFLDLRKKPEEPENWDNILETKKYGKQCLQINREETFLESGEDCLFLNIIQPKIKKNTNELLPVLVWIHGGGYSVGSSNLYNYKNLIDSFANQDIIVVSINYRLGIFGFSSFGDKIMPGNYGYWDQSLAIKFIHQNIIKFNGDNKKITIFGLSAGGSSVGALSISPHTRDYISKVIEMSGSTLSNWALGNDTIVHSTKEISHAVNCNKIDNESIKNCLKSKSVDEYLDGIEKIGTSLVDISLLKYKPSFDNDFFPKSIEDLIKESPKIPTYIGFTNEEGIFFTLLGFCKSVNKILIEPEDFQNYDEKKFYEDVKKLVSTEKRYGENYLKVTDEVVKFYVKKAEKIEPELNYRRYLIAYTQLASDLIIALSTLWEAELKAEAGWPIWLYHNTHYNPSHYNKSFPFCGSTHGHEYPYMFKINFFNKFEWNDEDELYYNNLVTSIGNFVKYDSPSTKNFEWKQYTNTEREYLEINDKPSIKKNLIKESSDFWKYIRDKYNYDIISDFPYLKKTKDEL
ncbi:Carboxylesterase, type B domain-containing protein [Strongyloides ratti]|uniref:Carboxylesterase, type B domain-containing protein n=1 Tax=Strongyloides ratti TaxID=34506 RepID=A0A090L0M6_STRRB|nr:Carboxylesterase, type B domain-containing protein [Strongyloides ratti]CEF63325.1 Carboxylesterase, type B domain-containing protein [Strongyloides ratti]